MDIAALRGCSAAAGRRTQEIAWSLCAEELDDVPDTTYGHRILEEEEVTGPNAAWLKALYVGKNKGWLLLQLALRHPTGHFGQATLVRKMQGLGSGGR